MASHGGRLVCSAVAAVVALGAVPWCSAAEDVAGLQSSCVSRGLGGDCIAAQPEEADRSEFYQRHVRHSFARDAAALAISEQTAEREAAQHKASVIEQAFAQIEGAGTYLNPIGDGPGEYIDQTFKNVTGGGKHWKSNIKRDTTWEACTNVNWTKVMARDESGKLKVHSVDAMMKELHLTECYDEDTVAFNDPTCVAVRKAISTSIAMETLFPEGPKFANYSVVSWGAFPSWVNGSVSGLDYAAPLPVQASLHHGNGVLGYALCDLIRTILTQSANQMSTGTCSYVASLAALSHKAPATVIKLGMRLLWVGEITSDLGPACPKVYEQQPGLVPFTGKDGGWKPPFFSSSAGSACAGSEVDCAEAAGRPTQNAGLTFMWSQTLISHWMSKNWGFCNNDTARAGITYPGMTKTEAAAATAYQGGWYNSMMWDRPRRQIMQVVDQSECLPVLGV
mmetsp:Transcript_82733/g.267911  ORF Transcript_82733/g.267911 Transcript_82733/m.267911 type:complete len:451 (+) Transcript_82733:49-1401(+)